MTLNFKLKQKLKKILEDITRLAKSIRWFVVIISICLVLFVLIFANYRFHWVWTGFNKSLWDWMQLLIIPAALALVAIWFNRVERRNEQAISLDNQQEVALQGYLDKMSDLLLNKSLRQQGTGTEVRNIARARTLTVLSKLDGKRKGSLLQFLYESGLIDNEKTIIDLKKANLVEADLFDAYLNGANLSQANLSRSNLNRADLYATHLRGAILNEANLIEVDARNVNLSSTELCKADLSRAILSEADLNGAKLIGANLIKTNLYGADLSYANLSGANLSGANLNRAKITVEQLNQAKSLMGTIMPNDTIHP